MSQISLFLTDSPKTLNSQNALSVTKFFLSVFPNAFVTYHCHILLLPRKRQKTKKSDWFSQILLILEAKFWCQSGKTNSFKPIILKSQFLKWHVVNCKVHNRVRKIKNSIQPPLNFIEINLTLSLTCSYEIVLKKWVNLPCNSTFLLFKLINICELFMNLFWNKVYT